MKNKISSFALIIALSIFVGCNNDDETPKLSKSTEYQLVPVNDSGVGGKATFTDDGAGKTEVLIELTGSTTSVHPAFIRYNNASEGGDVALTLKSCECPVGRTTVIQLDNEEPISYSGLLSLDGHISIHQGPNNLENIVATANIGANAAD